MKRPLLSMVLSLATFTSTSITSAQQMRWIGDRYEEGASLVYGFPDSDGVLLAFYCDRASRTVAVSLEYEPMKAEDGVEIDVNLALLGGGPRVSLRMIGLRLEIDDKFVLEGETEPAAALQRLLASKGTLVVTVEDGEQEIPLAGAGEAARELFAACDPKSG